MIFLINELILIQYLKKMGLIVGRPRVRRLEALGIPALAGNVGGIPIGGDGCRPARFAVTVAPAAVLQHLFLTIGRSRSNRYHSSSHLFQDPRFSLVQLTIVNFTIEFRWHFDFYDSIRYLY